MDWIKARFHNQPGSTTFWAGMAPLTMVFGAIIDLSDFEARERQLVGYQIAATLVVVSALLAAGWGLWRDRSDR